MMTGTAAMKARARKLLKGQKDGDKSQPFSRPFLLHEFRR